MEGESAMAVVLIADIPGMSKEVYQQAINHVRDDLKAAPGFMAHAGTPSPSGWRITEFWESRQQCVQFLESVIMPMAQQVGVPPFQPEFLEAEEAFTR
jgi:hypothetical protein